MKTEREFKIGDREFQLNKIDVFKQFHVARRLTPIMSEIISIAPKLANISKTKEGKEDLDKLAEMCAPIIKGFSLLSDADSNYILYGLLESVEIKQPEYGNWAFIVKNNTLMFHNLDMMEMLQIAGRALMYNMKGFFTSAPQLSTEGKSKQKTK